MSVTTRTDANAAPAPLPPMGAGGFARWAWRQLTSMRVALILLFCLAVASVPGSILPQEGNNPVLVDQWIEDAGSWGTVLERLGFFDVYASPWFAAIYLLLFVSLIGCVIPRARQHWHALRTPPPRAPRNLSRLEGFSEEQLPLNPEQAIDRAAIGLRGWRTVRGVDPDGSTWIAAERGYLREIGNLVFHLSLIGILIGVGVGGTLGWKGNVIVKVGDGFSNSLTQYDAWGGGRFFSADRLPPFAFTLSDFQAEFERGEAQRGAPRLFEATLTVQDAPGLPERTEIVRVNEPLVVDGAKVFLVGHGYAPIFTVRDSTGAIVLEDATVFLPQDGSFTSTGVLKLPDANPQLGFNGLFLPTTALDDVLGPHSTFPAPDDPSVFLAAFEGDLGLDSGTPQSVYSLDTSAMTQLGLEALRPGESWQLPEDAGSITFDGFQRWASFQIAHDPGKELALIFSVLAMLGIICSLLIRHRRIWVRARPGVGGSVVESAGLMRTEAGDLAGDLQRVREALGITDGDIGKDDR